MTVNNVTRFLDSRNIAYQVHELPPSKRSAEDTAQMLGVPAAQVYKSIVVERKGRGKPIIAVVPGDQEVDLKALAKFVDEKKVTAATQARAEQRTGLLAGGISPLALLNQGFEFVFDQSILSFAEIYISGGERSLSIQLSGESLISATGGKTAPIARN